MMSLTAAIVLFAVMSSFGWGRRYRRSPEDTRRLVDLEQAMAARDQELDQLHERVAELETRLDFTERLLAKGREERGSGP
jgi:uncharacterized protein YlxW (UPF0749 family)